MRIALIAGDGIGPEVTAQAARVLEALGCCDLERLPWSAEPERSRATSVDC